MTSQTVALVVAAGRGRRFGGETPKQYLPLGEATVIRHALECFTRHPAIDAVRAVIHPDDRGLYESAVAGLGLLEPVSGGETRQDSVRRGLESLESLAPARVLIHDAVRPFVDPAVIDRALEALGRAPGAIIAVPVRDTLKRVVDGRIDTTVERTDLWQAQTPQAFLYPQILAAHRAAAGAGLTDDAAVAERAGLELVLVAGDEANVKVTSAADLQRAEAQLHGPRGGADRAGSFEYRSGQGFDVHRFGPGDHVMLCGVKIDHNAGLIGHSDADAGLHALTDALLGAIGEADIGSHFPPGDPHWRDVDSATFLRHAKALLEAREGQIVNLDLTIICERPKIARHRPAMVMRISEILDLDVSRIAVKATTMERLGSIGRAEGLAAQAVATVRLPLAG
ncbi:MAG: bifunctional 2-C-methyl-D-erythritol 4-phosphate cytidylyltransferase/2-C-methyl-D-erythritol 2,4-cyclodiphosphate synthase [Kiloniellales bacterium]